MVIEFQQLFGDVIMPAYATVGSAGFDLIAHNVKRLYRYGNHKGEDIRYDTNSFELSLYPQSRVLIGLGFAISIPIGYQMEIRPRSGNALKTGLEITNSPGTIDSDYRGEVGVIITNGSTDVITIKKGDKIAQGIITEYIVAVFTKVGKLSDTVRGTGGYGSTDLKEQSERV